MRIQRGSGPSPVCLIGGGREPGGVAASHAPFLEALDGPVLCVMYGEEGLDVARWADGNLAGADVRPVVVSDRRALRPDDFEGVAGVYVAAGLLATPTAAREWRSPCPTPGSPLARRSRPGLPSSVAGGSMAAPCAKRTRARAWTRWSRAPDSVSCPSPWTSTPPAWVGRRSPPSRAQPSLRASSRSSRSARSRVRSAVRFMLRRSSSEHTRTVTSQISTSTARSASSA